MENKKRMAERGGGGGERLKVVKKGEVEEIAGCWRERLGKGEKIDCK